MKRNIMILGTIILIIAGINSLIYEFYGGLILQQTINLTEGFIGMILYFYSLVSLETNNISKENK